MTSQDTSPGAVLRAKREALGVTLREVAETLNLSIDTIGAIESDDLERLPGPVFARGYVRAYARLLEVDPRPLLEHYPKAQEPVPEPIAPEPPIWEWIRERPAVVLGAAGGGLLVLLLIILIALWPDGGEPEVPGADVPDGATRSPTPPAAAVPAGGSPQGLDREERGAAAGPEESARTVTAPSTVAPAPAEAASADDAAASEAPAASDTTASDVPVSVPRRITAMGNDRLSFGFSDDCWVEVKSASGARLYSDLSRAGAQLELIGQGPFRILLGYAPGVRLTFNGEGVPLSPHTRDNVATLVLGQ